MTDDELAARIHPPLDVAAETLSYGHYLNASMGRPFDDPDEQLLFDQDLAKAKAQMERAWLEAKPTQGDTPS